MTVLIAEDNRIERLAMEKLFRMYYPEVFEVVMLASNAQDAITLAKKHYFDLAMLDINMPDRDGLEVLADIRQISPNTRSIMVTAYSEFEYLQTAIRENAFDYILKPYSVDTFRSAVNRFLDDYWRQEKYGPSAIVGEIRKYLMENYSKPITLQDVADYVDMDKSYIGRIFKKEFGVGIIEYLNHYRLNKAEELLAKGMSVSETAENVGFEDPAYFGKSFKKYKGYSPRDVSRRK